MGERSIPGAGFGCFTGREATDIAVIERHTDDLIGLSLEEAEAMTGAVQQRFRRGPSPCSNRARLDLPACQARLRRNGSHSVHYRTPFGRLMLHSPRLYRCRCQAVGRQSVSPPAIWLGDHMSPELRRNLQHCYRVFPLACWAASYLWNPVILSAGIQRPEPPRCSIDWPRSTRNGPLSELLAKGDRDAALIEMERANAVDGRQLGLAPI
jgi:hypothetical protein